MLPNAPYLTSTAMAVTRAVLLLGVCCGIALTASSSLTSMEATVLTTTVPLSSHTPSPSPSPSSQSPSVASTTTTSPPHSSTSPSHSPTPTPPPTPFPDPEERYVLKDADGSVCILMNASIAVAINYTVSESKSVSLPLNFNRSDSEVNGDRSTCNRATDTSFIREAVLTIDFESEESDMYHLGFIFQWNTKRGQQKWWLHMIQLNFSTDGLDNYTMHSLFRKINATSSNQQSLFLNELQRSYLCDVSTMIPLDCGANATINATLDLLQWQVQAFEFKANGTFGNARTCGATSVTQVVPIAVGVALGLLIVVVLAAYIFGRVRSRRKSTYEKLS